MRAALPGCEVLLTRAREFAVGRDVIDAVDRDLAVVVDIRGSAGRMAAEQRSSRWGRLATTGLAGAAAVYFSGALSVIALILFVQQGVRLAATTSRPALVQATVLALAAAVVARSLTPLPVLVAITILVGAGVTLSAEAPPPTFRWVAASVALGGTAVVLVALLWLAVPWVALLGVVAIAWASVAAGTEVGRPRLGWVANVVLGAATVAAGLGSTGGVAAVVVGILLALVSGFAALAVPTRPTTTTTDHR